MGLQGVAGTRMPARARVPDAAVDRMLRDEHIVWLSTTRADGRPHLVPIWFLWDGESFLVFSKPQAQKVRNMRAHAEVMLALGDAEDDFDVQLVEGRAELLSTPARELLPPAMLEKYRSELTALGLGPDEYAATYSQVVRVTPVRFLGWRGRTKQRPSAKSETRPGVKWAGLGAGWLPQPAAA